MSKPKLVTIPIIGTVSANSIRYTEEEKEAQRAAKTVAAFLDGGPPQFLMEAVLIALSDAFDHFGLTKPFCDPEIGEGTGDYTEANLLPLFRKTRLTSLDQIYARPRRSRAKK
jgi:hypothetical protein